MSEPRKYGWVRDTPDPRDHLFAPPPSFAVSHLPPKVDLRPKCPPVYNQGQLGSCTSQAIAGHIEYLYVIEKRPEFVPSRLFIYWNERSIEGTVGSDSGAAIRDGIKVAATLGVPPENLWPYDINQFAVRPSRAAFLGARPHTIRNYSRLNNADLVSLKACLASGFPFVFGFTVYESFESQAVAQTGIMPMPGPGEQVLGGHAVMAVGYDDAQNVFIIRNSWGAGWGAGGYFLMPVGVISSPGLASDFWTIRIAS